MALAAGLYGWFDRVSWFVRLLAAEGSQTMPALSKVEVQLSLHKHDIAKDTQKHGNAKKLATNKLWTSQGQKIACTSTELLRDP